MSSKMYSHLGQGLISHLLSDSYTVCHVVGFNVALDVGLWCGGGGMVATDSAGPAFDLPHHVAQDCLCQPCH